VYMTTAVLLVLSDVDLLTIIAEKVRIVETADRSGCWDQASLLRVFRFALTCRAASMAVAVAAREWRILLATRVVPFAAAICYGAAATAGGGALVLVGCAMDMSVSTHPPDRLLSTLAADILLSAKLRDPRGMTTDGDFLYVIEPLQESVTLIRLDDRERVRTSPTLGFGAGPGVITRACTVAGSSLFVCDPYGNRVHILDKTTLAHAHDFGHPRIDRPTSVAAAAGKVFVGNRGGALLLFEADGTFVRVLLQCERDVRALAIAPDGQHLFVATGSWLQVLSVQDWKTRQALKTDGPLDELCVDITGRVQGFGRFRAQSFEWRV